MSHLLAFALCLAGFTALAFAMRRQQRDVIGRSLGSTATYVLRAAGACALLLALGFLVAREGWSLGLVMFSGHTSLSAGLVYCMLVGYAGMHARAFAAPIISVSMLAAPGRYSQLNSNGGDRLALSVGTGDNASGAPRRLCARDSYGAAINPRRPDQNCCGVARHGRTCVRPDRG